MADQTPPITPNPKKRGATSSGPKPPDEQNVARVAKLLDFDITEEFAEVLRKVTQPLKEVTQEGGLNLEERQIVNLFAGLVANQNLTEDGFTLPESSQPTTDLSEIMQRIKAGEWTSEEAVDRIFSTLENELDDASREILQRHIVDRFRLSRPRREVQDDNVESIGTSVTQISLTDTYARLTKPLMPLSAEFDLEWVWNGKKRYYDELATRSYTFVTKAGATKTEPFGDHAIDLTNIMFKAFGKEGIVHLKACVDEVSKEPSAAFSRKTLQAKAAAAETRAMEIGARTFAKAHNANGRCGELDSVRDTPLKVLVRVIGAIDLANEVNDAVMLYSKKDRATKAYVHEFMGESEESRDVKEMVLDAFRAAYGWTRAKMALQLELSEVYAYIGMVLPTMLLFITSDMFSYIGQRSMANRFKAAVKLFVQTLPEYNEITAPIGHHLYERFEANNENNEIILGDLKTINTIAKRKAPLITMDNIVDQVQHAYGATK